ncbi:mucin-5AC-like [Anopheles merus]|uniref:mucin-5AC-like n=1 Tax=Anopheles merus TaxID=30066 RepID=UPI001BE490F5|nr:mucin-5AC-like [Anopheles merus]
MTPPPPPPPPTPGATVPIAPPVAPNLAASVPGPPKGTPVGNGGDHTDQLMAAIRNGINLKPAKTNDRSTAAFIKQANGVLDENDEPAPSVPYDKSTSIDEMKDALQAELRNTLKRKIKKQDLEEGDCRKNEEIERSIELTRNEVQLKLNGPSPTPDTPKVDNPLKTIVDLVDKERGIAPVKQPSPVLDVQKKAVSVPSTPTVQPVVNGTSTLRKVSATQLPNHNGTTTVIQIQNAPSRNVATAAVSTPVTKSAVTSMNGNSVKPVNGEVKEQKSPTPVPVGKVISNGSSTAASPQGSLLTASVTSKAGASQTDSPMKATAGRINVAPSSPAKLANGSISTGGSVSNGIAFKINSFQPKSPPSSSTNQDPAKITNGNSYSNTLPRANVVSASKATPKTSTGAIPATYTSTVKVSIGSFGDSLRGSSGNQNAGLRNGNPTKSYEPLTIDTTSNGGASTANSSPTTPKELLSPQVRSGAASIRPSQIRTLTKAGSVVSHTDILETAKPVNKLPVTLVEPAPVLTAAAAVSPPPKVPSANNTAPLSSPSPAKVERTPLFEKANKEPPKSPLNRWADSSSSSGNSSVSSGTARKLLLTHGRPNFTIKRSNSRQGFDVDVADSKTDSAKPVFRILTDLEKMEQQADEGNQTVVTGPSQQAYVSFAKDLANAPNNHPDVVVVTKTSSSTAPTDPFLANLKDIKIDISEMKIVNAKNS